MNKNLPIYEKKEEIVSAVENNDTVIITAETGSGKSTQIPQYLYEVGYKVIVTQPRRIACITLADRVSDEMSGYSQDSVVGYHTAFESNKTEDTRILFCTDGLQMAKGIKKTDKTVLVLDEVHEWNLNIETLVAWIKKFREEGNFIKVVLMSATMESEALRDFYESSSSVSVIEVKGRCYDVEITEKSSYDYIDTIVASIKYKKKNVLAFAPGKKEIDDTINELKIRLSDTPAYVIPLHGELSSSDQSDCFKNYPHPKVVVATNIAQTSVTIPDIDVVVDSGTEKRVEVNDGIEGLFIHDISKADCLQRAGRAGRTKEGKYILCSSRKLEDREEFSTPEIQRLIIDKVVLKLASVRIDAAELDFFHQPSKDSIRDSKKVLRMLGALSNNDITDLGKRLVKFPVSVRSGKMILESERLGCVDDILKITSIIEVGSLINYRAEKEEETWLGNFTRKINYSDFTKEDKSDLLAELDILNQIFDHKYPDLIKVGLNKKNFFRIKEYYEKLKNNLESFNLIDFNEFSSDKLDRIKCIVSGISDYIYRLYYDSTAKNSEGIMYKLSRSTCVKRGNFVVGYPRLITYKDRWGRDCTMNILNNSSSLTEGELIDILGEDSVESKDREEDSVFDYDNKCFIIPFDRTIRGFQLSSGQREVHENDKEYKDLYVKRNDLVQQEDDKRVLINGHIYKVETDWNNDPIIRINSESDILNSDIRVHKFNGKPVEFRFACFTNVNLDIIRKRIINDKVAQAKSEIRYKLPQGKSGSTKVIIDEYLPKLGKVDLSIPQYNIEEFTWIGLELDKESASLTTFSSEDDSIKSTNDTLKFFISKVAKQNYGDKHFVIKRDGKKIETKRTESAKDDFHEYLREIIADTTADNFSDNLQFLEEVFNECIASMTA